MKRVSLQIHGKVQGVWYRKSTLEKARLLGVTGFVKNETDGSVYAEFQGSNAQIQEMIAWCKSGPKDANVEHIKTQEIPLRNELGFEILR